MIPSHEHAFYAWLIVIGAVCCVTIIGALIDRLYLNRRFKSSPVTVKRKELLDE